MNQNNNFKFYPILALLLISIPSIFTINAYSINNINNNIENYNLKYYDNIIKNFLKHENFTINKIAIDSDNFNNIKPSSIKDIKDKIFKSNQINEPVDLYRIMRLISQFQIYPNSEVNNACKVIDISKTPQAHIEKEFKALILNSKMPSLGIRWLQDINRLKEVFPEIWATVYNERNSPTHPEGTVFEHSMQSLDSSALLHYNNQQEKLIVMISALCHDLGKVDTTTCKYGKITSPGHASYGMIPTKNMLNRIIKDKKLIQAIATLVKWHMDPVQFIRQSFDLDQYRKLASDLNQESYGYVNISMLIKVSIADKQARNPDINVPLKKNIDWLDEFKNKAKEAGVLYKPYKKPII